MEKVHILITGPLDDEDIKRIAKADPRIEVTHAVEEVMAEIGIAPIIPVGRPIEGKFTKEEASKRLDKLLGDTDVILGWRLPKELICRAPRLKWVQGMGAGIDLLSGTSGLMESNITLTNASGIQDTTMAEFVFCFILMQAKRARELLANQTERRYQRFAGLELKGKTIGVIGLGHIGSEVARLAHAFGMKVLAMRRSTTRHQKNIAGVDEIFPPGQLLQLLPRCDWVVLTAPSTPETQGLIGEAQLKAMKPTAYIINVGRGPLIQQNVLIKALKEGWIAGAGLDVFEVEPLSKDSELWGLPNVILSPHIAGFREHHSAVIVDLFLENLKRFLAGEKLINLIDRSKGY